MSKDKASIIKADYTLQKKVGTGPIDERTIKSSQHVIDNNNVDFAPMALTILEKLDAALKRANDPSVTMEQMKSLLTVPVMELKANATIFHYELIGSLANIMLGFLETITTMDHDAYEIVKAHHASLHMIVVRKMNGDGGAAGKMLINELQQACDRYHHKKFAK